MKASITVIIIILLTLLHFSCKYDTGNTKNLKPEIDSLPDAQYESRAFTINIASPLPLYDSKHSFGDSILFKAEIQDTVRFDSICLFIDGKRIYVSGRSPFIYKWCSKRSRVGRHQYSTAVFSKGNKVSKSGNFILVSDIIPQNKSYKIIKSYQHDKSAYTQGLVYDNGILYEGTGQYGESAIRKIKIETGELIQSYTLPQNVFGEGIVVDKNRIIQLTWQSRIAYVFDKESFNFINKYTFQTQGWGITNYPGDNIRKSCFILSDGTSTLYFE
ncbi:MAG: glutaminyl-peptide cyclotransferase [Bacteroidia bacterium]|nr:glutaminyl-peptide cyclotransferase [Bacteroidia bacterium]